MTVMKEYQPRRGAAAESVHTHPEIRPAAEGEGGILVLCGTVVVQTTQAATGRKGIYRRCALCPARYSLLSLPEGF